MAHLTISQMNAVELSYPEHAQMSREDLLVALSNELKDLYKLVDHCSRIYDVASGGYISKPMTNPDAVIGHFHDQMQQHWEDGYKDGYHDGRYNLKPQVPEKLCVPPGGPPDNSQEQQA